MLPVILSQVLPYVVPVAAKGALVLAGWIGGWFHHKHVAAKAAAVTK